MAPTKFFARPGPGPIRAGPSAKRSIRPLPRRSKAISRPFRNDFETGTVGAAITAANSAGQSGSDWDDAWNFFGTVVPTYDSAHRHFGGVAMKITELTGSAATNKVGWNGFVNPPHQSGFTRIYIYLTASPSQAVQLIRFQDAVGTLIGGVRLTATRTLVCLKANNAIVGSASATLPLNQWIRVESRCLPSLTSGQGEIECRAWWTDSESTGATDYTANNTAVAALGGDTIDGVHYGIAAAPTAFTADWSIWIDDIAGNATDWVGPAPARPPIFVSVADDAFSSSLYPSPTLRPQLTGLFPESDTGQMTDDVVTTTVRGVTSTGATITDSVATPRIRAVTSTGATITDTIVSTQVRVVASTGVSQSDSVARTVGHLPPLADTGVSQSDSVQKVAKHNVADTGVSQSDSVAASHAQTRNVADTGASVSDTVASTRARVLADTGVSVTDTVATTRTRVVADTGVAQSDAVATTRLRVVASTGATVTDTIVTTRVRVLADTGATITDSVTASQGPARVITDTGVAQSDSVQKAAKHFLVDTGASVSDSLQTIRVRGVGDTGATVSDSTSALTHRFVSVIQAGATISDTVSTGRIRIVASTGSSISDNVAILAVRSRAVTDTGTAFSDTVLSIAISARTTNSFIGTVHAGGWTGNTTGGGWTGIPARSGLAGTVKL